MNNMKRLLSLVLALATLFSVCIFSVSAADEGVMVCGTSVPTSKHKLEDGEYTAAFSGVKEGIYTSKYFVANDSTIAVSFSNVTTTNTAYDKIAYWLYNMTSGFYVETSANYTTQTKSGGASASGAHAFITTAGYNYYVWFRSHNYGKMSGTIKVG